MIKKTQVPENESRRLQALYDSVLLDTAPDARLDRITRIAASVFCTRIVLVSLADAERQWFKSSIGLDVSEIPRADSFCSYAIMGDDIFEVPNALLDERFAHNPLVIEAPEIRFYAGAPLKTLQGYRIGTLCLLDDKPRQLSGEEKQTLRDIADCMEDEINNFERITYQKNIIQQKRMAETIAGAQQIFLQAQTRGDAFCQLLNDMVDLAESEYGFLSEVLYKADGVPYIKTFAISDGAWNEEMHRYYAKHASDGLEFHHLDDLLGTPLVTGKPVITNDFTHDSLDHASNKYSHRDVPHGHPVLNSYLGLPVYNGDTIVGMIGLANRAGGYQESHIDYLQPLLTTVGQMIIACRNEDVRISLENALVKTSGLLGSVMDASTEVAIIATDTQGVITLFNSGAELLLGYTAQELVGRHTPDIFHKEEEVNARAEELTGLLNLEINGFRTFVEMAERHGSEQREWTYLHKNGEPRTVSLVVTAIRNNDHDITGYLGIAQDITARKQAEARQNLIEYQLQKSTCLLRAKSHINALWLKDFNLKFVSTEICRMLVEEGGFVVSWIGWINDDTRQIGPLAIYGDHDAISIYVNAESEGLGPIARAIRESRPVVAGHAGKDDGIALLAGDKKLSSIVTPISINSNVKAVLIASTADVNYFGVSEISLFETIALNFQMAIKRKEEQLELLESATILKEAEKIGQIGSYIANLENGLWKGSAQLYKILGIEKSEPQRLAQYMDILQPAVVDQVLQTPLLPEDSRHQRFAGQYQILRKNDGEMRWIQMLGELVYDEQGNPVQNMGTVQDVTERKKIEDALKDSEAFNIAVLNSLLQHVAVIDNDGIIIAVNQAWKEFTGKNHGNESNLGLNYLTICISAIGQLHGEEASMVHDGIMSVLSGEKTEFFMEYACHAPHEQRWFNLHVTPLQGEKRGAVLVHDNITARKKIEYSLARATSLLEFTSKMGRIGGWELDLETNELTWSLETYHIHERDISQKPSLEEAINYYVAEFRHVIQAAVQAGIDHGTPWDLELPLITEKGRHIWVQAQGSVHKEGDRAVKLIGAFQDITERKQVERALADHLSRLNEAQNLAMLGSWEYIVETRQIYWSDQMYPIHGFHKEEGVPDYAASINLYVDAARQQLNEAIGQAVSEGIGFSLALEMKSELSGITPSRWVKSICRPIKDSNGKLLRLDGTVQDITLQKRLEDELYKYRNHLEEMVEVRTHEANRSREEAENANRAKSQFLSSMSHELRTPMNAILGFAQLLELTDSLDEQQQDYVREILSGGYHLLDLINEVLDLSKIEAGKIDLDLESVNLFDLVQDCFSLLKPLAEKKFIQLSLVGDRGLQIMADRIRFRQVVLNLLTNGMKYNAEYGVVDVLLILATDKVVIEVRDNGWGIAEENMTKLFLPFMRLHENSVSVEGTGIGLSITKNLVEMMGGNIEVESQLGMGSCFRVIMPVASQLPILESHEHEGDELDVSRTKGDIHKVLYIEDNPANLKLVMQLLKNESSIELLTAQDPYLGLDLALVHRPSLILLDINMPYMNGYELLKKLQQYPHLKNVPVIAITANAMAADIERGRSSGFSDYLTKPLDMRNFLKVIMQYLRSP